MVASATKKRSPQTYSALHPMLYFMVSIAKIFSNINATWGWKTMCHKAEAYKYKITSIMVYWDKPEGETRKLNTDGSSMEGSIKEGIGGIVRKGNGDMVMAYSKHIQFSTNISCELQAAYHGLKWHSEQHHPPKLILEMDSLVIVNMLRGQTSPPWRLRKFIEAARIILFKRSRWKLSTASGRQTQLQIHLQRWQQWMKM